MMSDVLQIPIEVLTGFGTQRTRGCHVCRYWLRSFHRLFTGSRSHGQYQENLQPRPEYAEIYQRKFFAYEKAQAALDFFHSV